MKKVLLIDNYDSFTYNLYNYLTVCGTNCEVVKNDDFTLEELIQKKADGIVLSPGPKTPNEAGITLDVIDFFKDKLPILGICLGHQAIAQYFGGKIIEADFPMHGKTSMITHNGHEMFYEIPQKINVMRYHSLHVIDLNTSVFEITAETSNKIIMAISHKNHQIWGIQFHPESILTDFGLKIIENWVRLI